MTCSLLLLGLLMLLSWALNFRINQVFAPNNELYKEDISSRYFLKCLDSERTFEEQTQVYTFKTNLENYSFDSSGSSSVSNYCIDGDSILCDCSVKNGESYITFSVCSGAIKRYYSLYFYEDCFSLFYSTNLSSDSAKAKSKSSHQSLFRNDESTSEVVPSNISFLTKYSINVSGTISWLDDAYAEHPLIQAKIKLCFINGIKDYETFTDDRGAYSISENDVFLLGDLTNPTIHICADSGNVSVNCKNVIYEKNEKVKINDIGFGLYSYRFSPNGDGDLGKAMYIFQAGVCYSNSIKSLNSNTSIEACSFTYPDNSLGSCGYSSSRKNIIIPSLPPDNGCPNTYAAWDVIGHEYGHHIESVFNLAQYEGGSHSIGTNLIDQSYFNKGDMEYAKKNGLAFAWGEAWPTFWSLVSQHFFPDAFKSVPTVNNSIFESYYFDCSFDLDFYDFSKSFGDADECAISRILYKLSDTSNDEFDFFSIPIQDLWNIFKKSKPHSFSEFVNATYEYGVSKSDFGKLLSRYKVTAPYINITGGNFIDEPPTFSWITTFGSSFLFYNDIYFNIIDDNGNVLLKKHVLTSSTWANVTLSKKEWGKIILSDTKAYNVILESSQTDYFKDGPYYSMLFDYNKPLIFKNKIEISPNEWCFEPQYFFTTNCENHEESVLTKNDLSIRSRRLRCGYIENSYVILSPRRQNAGIAYLELYFSKPVYSSMIGLTLWSASESLNSIDSIANIEVLHNGCWTKHLDLLNDISLSIKTQQIDYYESVFNDGIDGLKITLTSAAVGSRNKGLLCVENIYLNTDKDDKSLSCNYFN